MISDKVKDVAHSIITLAILLPLFTVIVDNAVDIFMGERYAVSYTCKDYGWFGFFVTNYLGEQELVTVIDKTMREFSTALWYSNISCAPTSITKL